MLKLSRYSSIKYWRGRAVTGGDACSMQPAREQLADNFQGPSWERSCREPLVLVDFLFAAEPRRYRPLRAAYWGAQSHHLKPKGNQESHNCQSWASWQESEEITTTSKTRQRNGAATGSARGWRDCVVRTSSRRRKLDQWIWWRESIQVTGRDECLQDA